MSAVLTEAFLPRITRILTNFRAVFVSIREIRGGEKVQHLVGQYSFCKKPSFFGAGACQPGMLVIHFSCQLVIGGTTCQLNIRLKVKRQENIKPG
jgi:hypothetical protein